MTAVTGGAPTKHQLGQMRHLDLLALAIRSGVARSDASAVRLGRRSKEQLVDELTRPGVTLTERVTL